MPSLNESCTNSQADNIATDFTTALLTIYSGTPPANASTALAGNTALAEHTLTGWGAAALGVITASAIANDVILATATATFARLVGRDLGHKLFTGNATSELKP